MAMKKAKGKAKSGRSPGPGEASREMLVPLAMMVVPTEE